MEAWELSKVPVPGLIRRGVGKRAMARKQNCDEGKERV